MNIGNNAKPKYKCDKCGKIISFRYRKGFEDRYTFGTLDKGIYHKAFDLCIKCNKELKNWLKQEPIPERITTEMKIKEFQIFKE